MRDLCSSSDVPDYKEVITQLTINKAIFFCSERLNSAPDKLFEGLEGYSEVACENNLYV